VIDINTFDNEDRRVQSDPVLFSLVSESDKENLPTIKKRSATPTKVEPARKKQKKKTTKLLMPGQKSITSFFQQTS